MKKHILFFLLIFCCEFAYAHNVGIGTAAPDSSAKLEVYSNNQGFLPPRMTQVERNNILKPALGLVIFNTTTNCLNVFLGSIWNELCGKPILPYPNGTVHCNDMPTLIIDVVNPVTGKTWMDRNLGATKEVPSIISADSYGSLFQWGRRADGHQCRNSATENRASSTPQPDHSAFILAGKWHNEFNYNLWQGIDGINNPCPSGYRLPTEQEWEEERLSWNSNNSSGALASPLKLTETGYRQWNDGLLNNIGREGVYWSSTINGTLVRVIRFHAHIADIVDSNPSIGAAIRCIKE